MSSYHYFAIREEKGNLYVYIVIYFTLTTSTGNFYGSFKIKKHLLLDDFLNFQYALNANGKSILSENFVACINFIKLLAELIN